MHEAVVPHYRDSASPRSRRIEDFAVPEPSPSEPVKASMEFRSAGDGTAELLVAVRIARAHYVHAPGDEGSKFAPLSMELTLPDGVTTVGDWIFPPPQAGRGGSPEYRDSVLLKRSLRIGAISPRTLTIGGVLRFQACTEELCWPAGKMELFAPLVIGPKPG
jgi:hypothetical protein